MDCPITENEAETIPLRGSQLVDQLIAEQDDVIRLLDELEARIELTILSLSQEREQSDKSAA